VCALANVFEAAGLATVSLVSVLSQAQRAKPPRALYCEFPLGRPLGRPQDPEFQHAVLRAAFGLLDVPCDRTPVLARFPDEVPDQGEVPFSCTLPPRFDPSLHPAADEARGLVEAYERSRRAAQGRTSFGKVLSVETVPAALIAFAQVAEGRSWEDVGPVPDPLAAATDVRTLYEEAATALAEHTPAAGRAEAWFFGQTEAAKVLLGAQAALKAAGHPGCSSSPIQPANPG
jgi:hypothetical protein